jgi:hypothetical protein
VEKSYYEDEVEKTYDDDDEVEKHIFKSCSCIILTKFFETSVLTRRQLLSSKCKYPWQAI